MDKLKEMIGYKSIEELRELCLTLLQDSTEEDATIRKLAAQVLPEKQVYGDSYGVPGPVEVVEALVKAVQTPLS